MTQITNNTINVNDCHEHHTAWTRGYVSRKSGSVTVPYKGRFGEGYKIISPSWKSTRYCHVTYMVK